MNILLISNSDFNFWQFRKDLIVTLLHNGHHVIVMTPPGPFVDRIRELGADVLPLSLKRYMNPVSDVKTVYEIYRVLKKLKIDLVFTIAAKANVYGNIAAFLAGVPQRYGLVSGLGYGFIDFGDFVHRVIQLIAQMLYRIAGRCTNKFVFQNEDDLNLFIQKKIVPRSKTHLIRGSGVNLGVYSSESVDENIVRKIRRDVFGVDDQTVVVGTLARATLSKGIREFIQTSRNAREWGCKVKFIHAGDLSVGAPDSIDPTELQETQTYQWIGFRSENLREITQAFDIITLLSAREGVPRSLLEGMALQKPVVTSDTAGCREVVDDGINGFIVPFGDSAQFSEKVHELVVNKELRDCFGNASRRKIENEFDVEIVNRRLLEEVFGMNNVVIPKIADERDEKTAADGSPAVVNVIPLWKSA